jgi:hypothetical protein
MWIFVHINWHALVCRLPKRKKEERRATRACSVKFLGPKRRSERLLSKVIPTMADYDVDLSDEDNFPDDQEYFPEERQWPTMTCITYLKLAHIFVCNVTVEICSIQQCNFTRVVLMKN